MRGYEFAEYTGESLVKLVRALGTHRYVAGHFHECHVFAVYAADLGEKFPELAAWANEVLADDAIDKSSRDPKLTRRVTHDELCAVLTAFWGPDPDAARGRLLAQLEAAEIALDPDAALFHEERDDSCFPRLIDAGVELLRLSELDPERHRGVIGRYDELALQATKFEEENAIPPREPYVIELPVLGAEELLAPYTELAINESAPLFMLWLSGEEAYDDYVLEGACKVAKLPWPYA